MQAIMYEGLNPHNDQKELVSRIMLQVIDQRVLARIEPTELMIRKDYLSLLSIPRRFNLSLMQELIEQFEPSLKMKSKLQYMGLPKTINQNVGVLAWDRQNVSAGCILSR